MAASSRVGGNDLISFVHTAEDQSLLHGAASIGSYVVVWLAAIVWPIGLAGCVFYGWWLSSLALVALAALCSIPLEPNDRVKAWMRRGVTVYFREASLRYELEVETPTVLAVHPHGIFCMGWATLFTQPALKDARWCFASVLHSSPLFRAFTSIIGRPVRPADLEHWSTFAAVLTPTCPACVCSQASADKKSFLGLMRQRKTIAILPGGFEEASISCPTVDRVYLKHRRGWIKYALEHGYTLTPSFTFGERETYSSVQALLPLRLWLGRTFGLPGTLLAMGLIFPRGRVWCPVLPNDRRLHIVVGPPVKPPTLLRAGRSVDQASTAQPTVTEEQVNEFHARYVAALVALYDRHKVTYYGEKAADAALEIW